MQSTIIIIIVVVVCLLLVWICTGVCVDLLHERIELHGRGQVRAKNISLQEEGGGGGRGLQFSQVRE